MKLEIINDKTQYSTNKHYNLGCILYTGFGDTVIKDHIMAFHQFTEGAGNVLCDYNRACMLWNDEAEDGNTEIILDIFQSLIDAHKHAPSKLVLALIDYEYGNNTDPVPFLKLVQGGELPDPHREICLFYLGQCQIYHKQMNAALTHLIEIAEYNMSETNYLIGELYFQDVTTTDPNIWIDYFENAVEIGNHPLADWRLNRVMPPAVTIDEVKCKAEDCVPFWVRICADLMREENTFEGFMEAAENYRIIGFDSSVDQCLEQAFLLVDEGPKSTRGQLKRMIGFDYLPARVRYTKILYHADEHTEDLERHLIVCKDQGDVISIYRLARIYQSWGRNTKAVKNYQQFASMSDNPLDAKERIKQIQNPDKQDTTEDVGAPTEETPSESSCDEFVKVEVEQEPDTTEKLITTVKIALANNPDFVGQALIDLINKKGARFGFYTSYITVLKKMGVSDKVIDPVIVEGANKGNKYCLRLLGKKWLSQSSKEEEGEMEEVD